MKQFLPLGTVVLLKDAEKKLMIVGRSQAMDGTHYDYSACLFPEGYIGSDQMVVFNQEDIGKVFYMGMQNEEEFAFRGVLAASEEKRQS